MKKSLHLENWSLHLGLQKGHNPTTYICEIKESFQHTFIPCWYLSSVFFFDSSSVNKAYAYTI